MRLPDAETAIGRLLVLALDPSLLRTEDERFECSQSPGRRGGCARLREGLRNRQAQFSTVRPADRAYHR